MNVISKKLLSMLVVVAMVFSMIPFGGLSTFAVKANAEETEAQDPANTGKNAPIDFTTSQSHVCPVCGGTAKTWQPLPQISTNTVLAAGHYYVPEGGLSNTANYTFNSNETRCIHLNNNTLQSSGRVFVTTNNVKLNIFGQGEVKSTAKETTGSTVYMNTSRVYLYGGTFSAPNATTGNPVRPDGSSANLYLYDGMTINSKGRCMQLSSGTVTMEGGTINGGSPTSNGGGAITMAGGSFNMNGGTINGGKATYGGAVYLSKGTFTMSGSSSISGGTATNNGGSVYVSGTSNSATFKMTGGSIIGGSAVNGGAVAINGASAVLNISAGSIEGGTSSSHGGTLLVDGGATMTMSGGTVNGGTAGGQGGTMRVYNSTVNLSGDAKVYAGSTTNTDMLTKGIWLIDSKLNMSGNATVYGNRTTVHGNAVYATQDAVGSTVTLSGGATIKNQTGISEKNLFLNYNATYPNKLQITQDWVGEAYWYALKDADNSYAPGSTIATSQAQVGTVTDGVFTAGGTFQGSLYYGVYTAGSMEAAEGVVVLPADARPNPANTGKNAPIDFTTSTTQVCPVCGGTAKTWQPLPQISTNTVLAAGHYYVPEGGVSNTAQYTFDSNGVRCIHLNGNTIASTTRLFNITNNAMINVFGSGQVNCNTGKELSDGAIAYLSTARLRFYGGTYSVSKGTPIWLSGSNSNFILYDGATITGGTVGNVRVANGTFTMEGGTISGGSDANGGNIRVTGGTFNMKGGTITGGSATTGGGNVYVSGGTFKMTGGKLNAGTAVNGGNLYVAGGTVTVTDDGDATTKAPQILGGSATDGGNIYAAAALTVSGGSVASGIASSDGGNIYATGDLSLTNCTISDGQATTNGGNINIAGTSNSSRSTVSFGTGMLVSGGTAKNGGSVYAGNTNLTMTAGEITGGASSNAGGCCYLGSGITFNMQGGTVSSGVAKGNGGNFYGGSTNTRLNISGGTVTGGSSSNSGDSTGGGNIFMNNGYLSMTGGTVSNGKAEKAYGGNIYSRVGTYDANNYIELLGGTITGGVSKNTGGNIYVKGDRYNHKYSKITLGAVTITNGDSTSQVYGDDLSLPHSAILTVKTDFASVVDVYMEKCCLPAVRIGGQIDTTTATAEGIYPGKLVLEQYAEKYELICKGNGDNALYICDTGVLKEDGTYIWEQDNARIVAAAQGLSNCILLASPGEMNLPDGDYVVDLRGNDVQFTGSGNVTCFDSDNDTFETFGTATFDGVSLVNTEHTQQQDKTYLTLEDNGVYSFHRYTVRLSSVSLRPSAAGIYYTGTWECDDTLKEAIDGFGVAVSIYGTPAEDFQEDGHSRYTLFPKSAFECGVKKTGVLITGILKDTSAERIALNATYAENDIYATAYLRINGVNYVGSSMAHSLRDVVETIHTNRDSYASYAEAMRSFLGGWTDKGLGSAPWNTFTFEVPDYVYTLNEKYAGRVAYQGEFHDHADTGGKSDGRATLAQCKAYLDALDMDFTTLLDHNQILHMELEEWDDTIFIGGSEMATWIPDSGATSTKCHVNMIFTDPEAFKDLMENHLDGKFAWAQADDGNYYYDVDNTPWKRAEFQQLIQDIKDRGGMYVFPHPKDGSRFISDNPEHYWFADDCGLEVFYGPSYYAPTGEKTLDAYNLWKDLLKLGKRLWATAGSDGHNVPNANALTTIYSERKHAEAYLNHAKQGDTTCGPIGIRMCVGDTLMGGRADFTGASLALCISDIHSSAYFEGHRYQMKLIGGNGDGETVVYESLFDATKPFYYGISTDDTYNYYRVEVYDLDDTRITNGMPMALGNPIWNIQEG